MRAAKRMLALLLAVLCLSGCAGGDSPEDRRTEAANAFLTAFFSFSAERYAPLDVPADQWQAAYDAYYQIFAGLVTERCLESLQTNRLPLKYDKYCAEKGIAVEPGEVRCEAEAENTYSFEVTFQSDEAGELFREPVKGRLTLAEEDGVYLVDSIQIH